MNEPLATDEPIAETETPGAENDLSLNPHQGHLIPPDGDETPEPDAAKADDQDGDAPPPVEDKDVKVPTAKEKKVSELAFENRQLKRQLEKQQAPPGDGQEAPEPLKTLKDFGYDENAHNEYLVDLAADRAAQKMEVTSANTSRETAAQIANDEFESREDAFEVEHPGFKEKLHAKDLKITGEMAQFIQDPASEVGLHVGDYLANNPTEAAKIAAMPAVGQVREMAKLESKISKEVSKAAAAKAKTSDAPPPPSGLNGEDAGLALSPSDPGTADKLSDEDWLKARNKQVNN